MAKALNKHIDFSKGYQFIDDLKRVEENSQNEAFGFSYKLDPGMKIDIEKAKQRKEELEKHNQEEFRRMQEKLKNA